MLCRDGDICFAQYFLTVLADALGVTVDYLVGAQELSLEGVEFRKKQIASRKEEAQVEARILHLLERYLANLFPQEVLNLQPSPSHGLPRTVAGS